jgi:hypothetical protein
MPLTRIQSLGITDGTIVNADINASAGIASTKLSGVTSEVKAWVSFTGTGTVAIRGSFNVSSITDNGTGLYTINFTTAMSDINYAFTTTGLSGPSGAYGTVIFNSTAGGGALATRTTSSIAIGTQAGGNGAQSDATTVDVAIFR